MVVAEHLDRGYCIRDVSRIWDVHPGLEQQLALRGQVLDNVFRARAYAVSGGLIPRQCARLAGDFRSEQGGDVLPGYCLLRRTLRSKVVLCAQIPVNVEVWNERLGMLVSRGVLGLVQFRGALRRDRSAAPFSRGSCRPHLLLLLQGALPLDPLEECHRLFVLGRLSGENEDGSETAEYALRQRRPEIPALGEATC